MIRRIPQRTKEDCVLSVVAMAMGPPYTYERVLRDSAQFRKTEDCKFLAWWERYLVREGFKIEYRRFAELYRLADFNGNVRGILGMEIPHLRRRHVVEVDELGIVDPADGAPDHVS